MSFIGLLHRHLALQSIGSQHCSRPLRISRPFLLRFLLQSCRQLRTSSCNLKCSLSLTVKCILPLIHKELRAPSVLLLL